MEKFYNSSSTKSVKVGGSLPFLIDPVRYRIYGAEVKNTLAEGEKIPAGTPFEYHAKNHTAKFLKVWKVKSATADAEAGTTEIVLYRNPLTPILKDGMNVMVAPSTVSGTGKAVAVSGLEVDDDEYTFTVTTANIDSVTANALLVEAAASGSGKAMYAIPNVISTEDIVAGNVYTMVDVPMGFVHAYLNMCNVMPDAVKSNLTEGMQMVWEYFSESHS